MPRPAPARLIRSAIARVKPYLRWAILGGTLFFLAKVLEDHWQEVAAIEISRRGWGYLATALAVTLLAHVWCGWVWSWILREFYPSIGGLWGARTYLKTNIAKYLPGNVWHFYGRIWAAKAAGVPLAAAIVSVLIEPLLMAAAALIVALGSSRLATGSAAQAIPWAGQAIGLAIVLLAVHPRLLNPLLGKLMRAKAADLEAEPLQVRRYPIVPLLGELSFVLLRSAGFLLVLQALQPIAPAQVPLLLTAFSLAWVLGLVIPGAPGGLGVFEATAIALLSQQFSAGIVLSLVALYRLISVAAEAAGAGLAWLSEQIWRSTETPAPPK